MLHLASQEKTFLLCQNSISTKTSSPVQSFIYTSRLPKHIVSSAQSSTDTNAHPIIEDSRSDYELIEIIRNKEICYHVNPSLTKPSNKAPPKS
jgi:hypothetical protein